MPGGWPAPAKSSPIQLRRRNGEKENGTPDIVHDETIQLAKHRRERRAVAKLGHRFSINAVGNQRGPYAVPRNVAD
jgi:hypothetical protein